MKIPASVLLAIGLTVSSGVAATAQEPRARTATRTPRRSLLTLENSLPSGPPKTRDQPATSPPAGASGEEAAAPAGLDAEIASLEARLARAQQATMETIQPLDDLPAARRRAAEYRRNVDRMRRLLYVSDPKPDGPTAKALEGIRSAWGDLSRPIVRGELPGAPISRDRFAQYASAFRPPCAGNTASVSKQTEVPMRGWAWACLSDAFFTKFSAIEANVENVLKAKRRRATQELDGRMRIAEERLALVDEDGTAVSRLFLKNLSWLLFEVWVEATKIRIHELEIQRDAGSGTPAFRWFLEMTPAVPRPLSGSRNIAVDAGAPLKVKAGKVTAEARVTAPRRTLQSNELHQVHFRLAGVEHRVDDQIAEELADYRRSVSDPQEIEARTTDLQGRRAARIQSARESLEKSRADTLTALAAEAK